MSTDVPQNTFRQPENTFSPPPEDTGSTLQQLKERLGIRRREQWIILGVVILAVVAGVLLFFRPQSSTPPPASFSPIESHTGDIEVTFSGSYDVPIEAVQLYTVLEYVDQNTLLRTFAERLEMQPAEFSLSGNTYISENGDATLTMAAGQQGISYNRSAPLRDDLPIVSETSARTVAGDFLARLGYSTTELTLLENQTQYFSLPGDDFEDFVEVPPEGAVLIRLYYEKQLDGLPITFGASSIEKFQLDITADGLYSAVLPNTFFTPEAAGQHRVRSVELALESIRQGEFSIIGTTTRVQKENKFIELHLENQDLQYRFDQTSQTLFPVFRFTGTALTESYQELPITVVTEAIAVQSPEENGTVEPTPTNTSNPE